MEATEKQIKYAMMLGIADAGNYDKATLSKMIDAKAPKTDTVKPHEFGRDIKVTVDNKNTTMYTSYAKDVFIAMPSSDDLIKDMDCAIKLIKQARDAFS